MVLFLNNMISKLKEKYFLSQYKSYNSFDDAFNDSNTYGDCDIIKVVSLKTQNLKESLANEPYYSLNDPRHIKNMFVLLYINLKNPLKIIELGGACGATYFSINSVLPGYIKSWTIVETDRMVQEAKEKFEDNILHFISINEYEKNLVLQKEDILIVQGVLQYLKDPIQFFEILQKQDFQYIYLSRTVVSEKIANPIVTKQITRLSAHGPGEIPKGFHDRIISLPLTIIPFDMLKTKISVAYHILFLFDEGEKNIMHIDNMRVETKMIGILLERRDGGDSS